MLLLIIFITLILLVYSYAGAIISWLLTLITKTKITVGGVGLFELRDVGVHIAHSLNIHVDRLKLQRDVVHPTRFFVLNIGDVRIDGEPKKLANGKNVNDEGRQEKIANVARIAQYCGLVINRVHLIVLEVIPGCMVHVTVDDVSIEMFRSRDGWQLETSSSLIQAKVLRRNSPNGSLIAEVSLPLHLSLDLAKFRINKIGLKSTSPSFAFTNNVFDIMSKVIENRQDGNDKKLNLIDWNLHLDVEIESILMKYTANVYDSQRTITLTVRRIQIGRAENSFEMNVNGFVVADELMKSLVKTSTFVVDVSESANAVECRVSSDQVDMCIAFDDAHWWRKHLHNVHLFNKPSKSKNEIKRTLDCVVELASISCDIVDFEQKTSYLTIGFVTFQKVAKSLEIGIEMLNFGEKVDACFERHKWGQSVFVGALLVQWEPIDSNELSLTCGSDDVKIEWSDRFAKQINDVLTIAISDQNEPKKQDKKIGLRLTANRTVVLVASNGDSFAALSCRKLDAYSDDIRKETSLSLKEMKGAVGTRGEWIDIRDIVESKRSRSTAHQRDVSPSRRWNSVDREEVNKAARRAVDEGINPKVFLETMEFNMILDRKSAVIDSISIDVPVSFYVSWSPHLHFILKHFKDSITLAFTLPNKRTVRKVPRKRHFFVFAQDVVEVQFELARDHKILWKAMTLHFEKIEGQMTTKSKILEIWLNSNVIVTTDNPLIMIRPNDELLTESRMAIGTLESLTNKTWTWAADRFEFRLPFDFNFAEVLDEFINVIKWIKIVGGVKKKPFTKESPLPSDVRIEFKEVVLQLDDDCFETRLKCSYDLKEDEVYEIERRAQILEERLLTLKKNVPLIPKEVLDQLTANLTQKNSEIYIERWNKSEFEEKPLFYSKWKGWNMKAFADMSLHGTEECIKLMKEFDPLSPLPENTKFSTLWARSVEFDVDEWTVNFKDYPMKYLDIHDLHFFGTLVGAETFQADGRSIRQCTIPVSGWPTMTIERNMSPLKFYYDMQCASRAFTCTYGPCWEPCLSMISLMWNNISAPSRDPSPPLPFWDKMRFILHGKLLWSSERFLTTMLASNDPYNETETVEMCWDDLGLDWALGEIRIKSGLRVFLRTASRYDDSRVLTLPDVRVKILLGWECGGDPHDHHSIVLCSPQRMPHYSSTDDHDTYRSFRSSCVNVTLNFDVSPGSCTALDMMPNVLIYSNTFRFIEQFLKSLTMKNRNVRRGKVFGNRVLIKPQLSKHFGKLQVSISLPKAIVTYWMSHSSPFGFRLFSDGLQLTASFRQTVQHSSMNRDMNVQRRKVYSWSTHQMTCTWWATQVHVYANGFAENEAGRQSDETFLMGFSRVQYSREITPSKEVPVHKVAAYDLKTSWTEDNRNACLTIADGVHRAHMLRRILSNDAVRKLRVHMERKEDKREELIDEKSKKKNDGKSHRRGYSMTEANPWMLTQLIDEVGTKLVAHCEQSTDVPIDSLVGVQQSTSDDVRLLNWQIDLYNSQLVLKGCQRDGFLLVCAAKAQLVQNIHRSVWKSGLLLSKKSWRALLSGMQYFAPISMTGENKQKFQWLPREVIEEKVQDASGFADDFVQKYSATGEAVGGVVQLESNGGAKHQLQRIVSRCSCQIYFCYFSDELKTDTSEDISVPPPDDEKRGGGPSGSGSEEIGIDVLTLKHNMLEATSNSEQYEMVVDIVNNLVLYVDPLKKELDEKRRRLRFESQIMDTQELRYKIMRYQSDLREIVSLGRYLERQLFYLQQGEHDKVEAGEMSAAERKEQLETEAEETKQRMLNVSEKLATYISCYKQRQLNREQELEEDLKRDDAVIRRFEVCFEDCIWKLTESDGQIALAQTQIRNFLYTRTVRSGNCGEHLFEVGSVRVTNLLPDTIYKHALHRDESRYSRQPAIRLFVRDMPPVGGICVKEHFELNIAPMVAEITHRLFDKMMRFFFPGRNIHTNESIDNEMETSTFSFTRKIASTLSMRNSKQSDKGEGKLLEKDDIDRMKERADQVNHFMYIKIPEVSFVVSYKGNKDKNLIDVNKFNFNFPLCEFHEQNWTWLDLALAVKQRCKRVLLQQFMRQKLLRNRISNLTVDPLPQGVSEEEKKKIAIGVSSMDQKKKK